AFRVPKNSLDEWHNHLTKQNIKVEKTQLFNQDTHEFDDIHGLELAIVEGEETANDSNIISFHGAVLLSINPEGTDELLTGIRGVKKRERTHMHRRQETVGEEKDLIITSIPTLPRGNFGIGTVHHIAWSVPNVDTLTDWQTTLQDEDFRVTEVRDRDYFKSIYLAEKGKIVFEFATDGPGFDLDEDKDSLGTALKLPEQYEYRREEYETLLPKLDI